MSVASTPTDLSLEKGSVERETVVSVQFQESGVLEKEGDLTKGFSFSFFYWIEFN